MEFTHIANPVRVTAYQIRDVIMDQGGNYNLTLDNGREYQAGLTMTSRHVPQTGDYLVRQEDGYEYLNPKDVFERKYRVIGAETDPSLMEGYSGDFGYALSMLKAGHRVARAGWNGKGMWLCLGTGNPALPAGQFWNQHTREFAESNGGAAPVLPYIIMKTAGGEILMGWLASQTDMLADDWRVVA